MITKDDLFSSVEHSRGQRVRLDLKDINQFSLFPGQVTTSCSCAICIM
jgi:hypothetical protein